MRRDGPYHVFEDCWTLLRHDKTREKPISAEIRREISLWIDVYLCRVCREREEWEGTIDDMNSVWFGLGPDFAPASGEPGPSDEMREAVVV